jgi:hypothetical protein
MMLPHVGRPWRFGRDEDPNYQYVRFKILEAGLVDPGIGGDTLLAAFEASTDLYGAAARKYLRFWIGGTSRATVARQFSRWLADLGLYLDAHDDTWPTRRRIACGEATNAEVMELMETIYSDLGLPHFRKATG